MLGNIAKNYASLASFRIGARIMQFLLRTYLIRQQLDSQILGRMINLDIILTISTRFNKTCLKPSYQRMSDNLSFQYSLKSAMNTMTIGIFTTFTIASIISLFEISYYSEGTAYFDYAILFYALAAVCHAIQQKYCSQMILKYQYKKLGIIEMCSFLPKTGVLLFASNTGLLKTYGLAIFGIGQLIYSCLFMLITYLMCSNKSIFLQKLQNGTYIDEKTKQILKQLSIVSVLKMILSEIEKIIIVVINVSLVSSVYSLIFNFGSIIVRYVFLPIEQIQYNYFSRGKANDSLKTFQNMTFALIVFGIISLSYGYHYSQTVLLIVYGERWTNQNSILALRVYAVLLCLTGINGTMQAFVFARAKPNRIATYKYYSVISSVVLVTGAIYFYHFDFGAASMFLGSILSMFSRVIFAWFIQVKDHYGGNIKSLLKQIVPPYQFFAITSVFFFSISYLKGQTPIINMLIGACLCGANLLPIIYYFRKQIKIVLKNQNQKEIKKQDKKREQQVIVGFYYLKQKNFSVEAYTSKIEQGFQETTQVGIEEDQRKDQLNKKEQPKKQQQVAQIQMEIDKQKHKQGQKRQSCPKKIYSEKIQDKDRKKSAPKLNKEAIEIKKSTNQQKNRPKNSSSIHSSNKSKPISIFVQNWFFTSVSILLVIMVITIMYEYT